MNGGVLGGLLGAAALSGMWIMVRRVPMARRPHLVDRLAPYLRGPEASRLIVESAADLPFPTLQAIARPLLRPWAARLDALLGAPAATRARLRRAGSPMSLEAFRLQQVAWGAAGLLAGLLLALPAVLGARATPVVLLALAGSLGIAGLYLRDHALTRTITRRERRMAAELPTVAEMLALAVSAGESPLGAIERVVRISQGELARELRVVVDQARTGVPLSRSLDELAAASAVPGVARFVDGLVIAIERGTPLADVLRAQAVDAREAGRRELMEAGGRKEIAMLVPVVFLVLPITVIFALFPGFYGLSLTT